MAGKGVRVPVEFVPGDTRALVGDLNKALEKVGAGGIGTAGLAPGAALTAGAAAQMGFANAALPILQGALQGGAQALSNPYTTQAGVGRGVAAGVAAALPGAGTAIGGIIGSAAGPGGTIAGAAVGNLVGTAAEVALNRAVADSANTQGAAEDEFRNLLGSLGAAGVDTAAPEYTQGLGGIAKSIRQRFNRMDKSRKDLSLFSSFLSVDSMGVVGGS